jgi:hypothetical protein
LFLLESTYGALGRGILHEYLIFIHVLSTDYCDEPVGSKELAK